MKKIIPLVAMCIVTLPALAVTGRSGQMMAPRQAASTNQISMASMTVSTVPSVVDTATTAVSAKEVVTDKSSIKYEDVTESVIPAVDKREKEKAACINNNIGVGNTFVWASRYSNTNNYSSMVEDIDNPENNTCFVRVEIKSDDAKVSVADVPGQYFEMGRTITCGSWADADKIEKRILDAKKSARTWGTVAGAVGGAAVGVGAMELFGNKLIGGAVQGQKALSGNELLRSQLLTLKKDSPSEYKQYMKNLRELKAECESEIWDKAPDKKPDTCEEIDYDYLLRLDSAK